MCYTEKQLISSFLGSYKLLEKFKELLRKHPNIIFNTPLSDDFTYYVKVEKNDKFYLKELLMLEVDLPINNSTQLETYPFVDVYKGSFYNNIDPKACTIISLHEWMILKFIEWVRESGAIKHDYKVVKNAIEHRNIFIFDLIHILKRYKEVKTLRYVNFYDVKYNKKSQVIDSTCKKSSQIFNYTTTFLYDTIIELLNRKVTDKVNLALNPPMPNSMPILQKSFRIRIQDFNERELELFNKVYETALSPNSSIYKTHEFLYVYNNKVYALNIKNTNITITKDKWLNHYYNNLNINQDEQKEVFRVDSDESSAEREIGIRSRSVRSSIFRANKLETKSIKVSAVRAGLSRAGIKKTLLPCRRS